MIWKSYGKKHDFGILFNFSQPGQIRRSSGNPERPCSCLSASIIRRSRSCFDQLDLGQGVRDSGVGRPPLVILDQVTPGYEPIGVTGEPFLDILPEKILLAPVFQNRVDYSVRAIQLFGLP